MFRKMLRYRQELDRETCIRILKEEKRGILSLLGDDDYPYGVPVNHYYDETDGSLYFHSGMKGHKIDAMKRHDKASFCVYDSGFLKEGDWALNISSVIVFGRIEFIEDPDEAVRICRLLSYKFTNDNNYIEDEIRRSADHTLVFALRPEHMSGKLVNEK
ncbi:MAG: pyridoxamine 5'-phosphate oxidase family protein [Lachnospiraceae bacterium]|nr:pyridoxamine 5'-phosphate oxidase family protein [Lachnospiraceae bacterium]